MSDNCNANVLHPGTFRARRCHRKAVRDGFCSIHHPDAIERLGEKRNARWKAKQEQLDLRSRAEKEMRERARAYPRLADFVRNVAGEAFTREQLREEAQSILREISP